MTKLPKFSHEDKAINNFVNIILSKPDIDDRNEMILAFGAVLGNNELVNYVSEIDPTIIPESISNRVIDIIDQICGPFFRTRFGDESEEVKMKVKNRVQRVFME